MAAPEGQVRLNITHSVLPGHENFKNFVLSSTISQFKQKLQLWVGTDPAYMKLELFDKEHNLLGLLENDDALLSSFHPTDGMEIHVVDVDPNNTIANLTDTSKGEKYVMSDADYMKRDNSVRKIKEQEAQSRFQVGDRCDVLPDEKEKDTPIRKGTIMFVGAVDGAKGVWIGVKLDEPHGKNDGTAKGKRYFECEANYGLFVKTERVTIPSTSHSTSQASKDEI